MGVFPSDERPLLDRSLKYGRNVLAVSSTILVLAWVPNIDICDFSPLGFKVTGEGALSLWGILTAVLGYYLIHFVVGCMIDFKMWTGSNGFIFWAGNNGPTSPIYHIAVMTRHALILDIFIPIATFLAAEYAVISRVKGIMLSPAVACPISIGATTLVM